MDAQLADTFGKYVLQRKKMTQQLKGDKYEYPS
jgi:hypothetical protein